MYSRTPVRFSRRQKAYNRGVKFHAAFCCLLAVLLFGCGRGSQTPEAVRQGVVDYLSSRPDLDPAAIEVSVISVSFRQNEADTTVAFRPKGGGPASGMEMRYSLERKGGRWVVKGKGQALPGTQPHGAQAPQKSSLPPDHPPLGSRKPSGTAK